MDSFLNLLKFYLLVGLATGILSLVNDLLSFFSVKFTILTTGIILLSLLFYFFSILAIVLFHHYHVEKIAYVLPIYVLAVYSIFFVGGFIFLKSMDVTSSVIMIFSILSLLTSLFEIGFVFYLMKHLQVFQEEE